MGNTINVRTVYDGREEAQSISDEIESYQRNNNSINNETSSKIYINGVEQNTINLYDLQKIMGNETRRR